MASQFDFRAFNALTDRQPAGLQVALAESLLANALWQFDRWDNPRAEELRGVFSELKQLRTLLKQDAKLRNSGKGE